VIVIGVVDAWVVVVTGVVVVGAVVVGVVVASSVVVVVGDDTPPQEAICITAITDNKISDRDNDLPIFLSLYQYERL